MASALAALAFLAGTGNVAALTVTASGSSVGAAGVTWKSFGRRGQSLLQPDMVAQRLATVEQEWRTQASLFAECGSDALDAVDKANCEAAPRASKAFGRSCGVLAAALIRGSNGNKNNVIEFLGDVCKEDVLKDSRRQTCLNFANTVEGAMTPNNYANRMDADTGKLCSVLWQQLVGEEKQRQSQEAAHRGEQGKKLAESAAEEKTEQVKAKEEAQRRAALEAKSDAEEAAKASADEEAAFIARHQAKERAEEAAKAKKEKEVVKANADKNATATANVQQLPGGKTTLVANSTTSTHVGKKQDFQLLVGDDLA